MLNPILNNLKFKKYREGIEPPDIFTNSISNIICYSLYSFCHHQIINHQCHLRMDYLFTEYKNPFQLADSPQRIFVCRHSITIHHFIHLSLRFYWYWILTAMSLCYHMPNESKTIVVQLLLIVGNDFFLLL